MYVYVHIALASWPILSNDAVSRGQINMNNYYFFMLIVFK